MSDHPAEFHRETGIDNRRDSYRGFFNAEWANDFLDILKSTTLFEAGVDLTRNWHAASNARTWPWLMTEQWQSDLSDSLDRTIPFDSRKIELLCQKLADHLEARGIKVSPAVRGELRGALRKLDQEITDSLIVSREEVRVSHRALWEDLINVRAFHDAIWSSERTCYSSLYFTYEWFLKEAIRVGRIARGELNSKDGYRICRESEGHLRDLFGGNVKGQCWNGRVKVAREARHVLAHNAGKITPKLAKMDHPFLVCNDEIQVAAAVTTELFTMLKDRTRFIATKISAMTEFASEA